MPCVITDVATNTNPAGGAVPLPGVTIIAQPAGVPLFELVGGNFREVPQPARSVVTDASGNWSFTLPWPSEQDPSTTQWQIITPDRAVWQGTVPEGVAGPLTLHALKNLHGWGLVVGGPQLAPPVVVQGPPGTQGPPGPTGLSGIEVVGAPGPLSLAVGTSLVNPGNTYTIADGTTPGQQKRITALQLPGPAAQLSFTNYQAAGPAVVPLGFNDGEFHSLLVEWNVALFGGTWLVLEVSADKASVGVPANSYVVRPVGTGFGNFTTIAAAITAAVADGANRQNPRVIYLMGGAYTENFTLPDGIHLVGVAPGRVANGGGGLQGAVLLNCLITCPGGPFPGPMRSISGVTMIRNDFASASSINLVGGYLALQDCAGEVFSFDPLPMITGTSGFLFLRGCNLMNLNGPVVSIPAGSVDIENSVLSTGGPGPSALACGVQTFISNSTIIGANVPAVRIESGIVGAVLTIGKGSRIVQSDGVAHAIRIDGDFARVKVIHTEIECVTGATNRAIAMLGASQELQYGDLTFPFVDQSLNPCTSRMNFGTAAVECTELVNVQATGTGIDASGGAGPVTVVFAQVGDVVASVFRTDTGASVTNDFEKTVSVAGQVQQLTSNLNAVNLVFILRGRRS